MMSPYQGSVILMRNNDSSDNESMGSVFSIVQERSHMSSTKMRDFLEVLFANSNSNS